MLLDKKKCAAFSNCSCLYPQNAVAKPSSRPTLHVTESKVTSRADSVGNRKPYGQWIPVKTASTKKR